MLGIGLAALMVTPALFAAEDVVTAVEGTVKKVDAAGKTVVVAGDLAPFSPVTVNCSAASHAEGPSTVIWIYDVSAVAQTTGSVAGNQDFVQRVIRVKLGN